MFAKIANLIQFLRRYVKASSLAERLAVGRSVVVVPSPAFDRMACATSRVLWPTNRDGKHVPLRAVGLSPIDGRCANVLMPRRCSGSGRQVGTFAVANLVSANPACRAARRTTLRELFHMRRIRLASGRYQKRYEAHVQARAAQPDQPQPAENYRPTEPHPIEETAIDLTQPLAA
jgi:hypothetical protein